MALTLVEAAKLMFAGGQDVRGGVINMFARASDILRVLPFKDIVGNAYAYNREGSLPAVAFRGVNEAYAASTGVINPLVEALRICGGDLDVDKFIVKTGGDAVRSTHESLKVKALAAEVTRAIIKGDSTTQPREFDGLQTRLVGNQLVAAGATGGGDALSLAILDEMIDQVPGITHLIMNKPMRRRMSVAARAPAISGYVVYTQDEFGKRLMKYNDIPILVAYDENDGTDPIAFDEVCPGGGANTGTSIYGVNFSEGRVTGLQSGIMDVTDLGELDTQAQYRTRVEWYMGLCVEHGLGAARLWGISNAAIVV